MDATTRKKIEAFVHTNIASFHSSRLDGLRKLKLEDLLRRKNPYLFRAKNLTTAESLISALLDARLSSGEEGGFGRFLEDLAIFVAKLAGGVAQKTPAKGIDIDLTRGAIRYLIAVKSGRDWGNSSQHAQLKRDFREAVRVLRQSKHTGQIQPTLGICYGKFKTVDNGEYLHIGGQSFWHLLSNDRDFYIGLVEPLGHDAALHDANFVDAKNVIVSQFVRTFRVDYCNADGSVNWSKLVRFVSANM